MNTENMWRQWPVKKAKKLPISRTANLSNLHVIETSSLNSKSSKDVSCTESSGHSKAAFSGCVQNTSQYVSPSKNLNFKTPSKSLGISSKLKRKYFHKRDKHSQFKYYKSSNVKSDKLTVTVTQGDKNSKLLQESEVQNDKKDSDEPPISPKNLTKHDEHPKSSNLQVKDQKSDEKPSSKKLTESAETVLSSDANEDCFEEVEVASYETESQEIPVSFRKTKVRYLKYKKQCFFKPKIYNIDKEAITVSCLSTARDKIVSDVSVEKRKPSELDNQEKVIVIDKNDQNKLIKDDKQNDKTTDVKDNAKVTVTESTKNIVPTVEHVATKKESPIEPEKLDNSSNQSRKGPVPVKPVPVPVKPKTVGNVIEVIQLDDDDDDTDIESVHEEIEIIKCQKKSQSTDTRVYKKFESDTLSVYQGKSIFQSSLDTWKSHLIGIEYMIEVQDKATDTILSHHCVLCKEELPFGKFRSIVVLNHINSYDHIVNYMEKVFPNYNLKEIKGFNNIRTLQKVCEEINKIKGYFFLSITALDQFAQCKESLEKALSEHSCEKSLNSSNTFIQKVFEDALEEEIKEVMKSIFDKIREREKTASEKRKIKSLLQTHRSKPISSYLKLEILSPGFRKPSKSAETKSSKSNEQDSVSSKNTSDTVVKPASLPKAPDAKTQSPVPVLKSCEGNQDSIKVSPIPTIERLAEEKSVSKGIVQQKEVVKCKEKPAVAVKPGLHSKHCPKRNLIKENSRPTAKTSLNNELANNRSSEIISKCKHVVKPSNLGTSNIVSQNKGLKQNKLKTSNSKRVANLHNVTVRKINSVDQASPVDSNQATGTYRQVNIKVGPSLDNSNKVSRKVSSRSDRLPKERSTSPYKRIVRRVSKSPPRRVISSPLRVSPARRIKSPIRLKRIKSPLRASPTRRITSPLRVSPGRRHSRSPGRRNRRPLSPVNKSTRRHSRSPGRRYSRSPVRRRSRSPVRRRSRSPVRRRSRSPVRRGSRSPVRRGSRSPVRRGSRSPVRRRSRSPVRRRSRSPVRRRSRSPLRGSIQRHSRSPMRRISRSPIRRHLRSPDRDSTKSPIQRHARSPPRRHSKSPRRKFSRSPQRKRSRSPFNQRSRSPITLRSSHVGDSVSSMDILSGISGKYKNTFRTISPSVDHRIRTSSRDSKFSSSRSPPPHISDKYSSRYDSIQHKLSAGRNRSPGDISEKIIPFLSSISNQEFDLDPISDEDESKYFGNVDEPHSSDSKLSSQKKLFAELLKKFSLSDINPNDTAVNKFLQFMQAHSSEIQEFIGSQFSNKSSKLASLASANAQEKSLFLQQYLLQSLAGKKEQMSSNASFAPQPPSVSFGQQAFALSQPPAKFGHAQMIPGLDHVEAPMSQANIFPPNLSMPPPNQFAPVNQKPVRPRAPSEAMFKDLKATVNKIFGPHNSQGMPEAKVNLRIEQDPSNFDQNLHNAGNFGPPNQMPFNPNFSAPPSISNEMQQQYDPRQFFSNRVNVEQARGPGLQVPPPHAKVSFCDSSSSSVRSNLFPVVNRSQGPPGLSSQAHSSVNEAKVSLAQRLASVLVKVGMIDVPAPLLQEMLMKIGAFSSSPPQDITEEEIVSILKRLGYL